MSRFHFNQPRNLRRTEEGVLNHGAPSSQQRGEVKLNVKDQSAGKSHRLSSPRARVREALNRAGQDSRQGRAGTLSRGSEFHSLDMALIPNGDLNLSDFVPSSPHSPKVPRYTGSGLCSSSARMNNKVEACSKTL